MNMPSRNCAGFTLIEVLVSMFVLAIGVLGVAATQIASFQTNQSAYARSQAIYLAQDMFDRIRANPEGYQASAVYDDIDSGNLGGLADPGCVDSVNGCTPEEMAQRDVLEWSANFDNVFTVAGYRPTLPNGRGVLARVGTSNDFTATISWDEKDWSGARRVVETRQLSITARMN